MGNGVRAPGRKEEREQGPIGKEVMVHMEKGARAAMP